MVANIPLVFYLFPGCILCHGRSLELCTAALKNPFAAPVVSRAPAPLVVTTGKGTLWQMT